MLRLISASRSSWRYCSIASRIIWERETLSLAACSSSRARSSSLSCTRVCFRATTILCHMPSHRRRRGSHVQPRAWVAVLHPQALDELGRVRPALRELLAHPLAQRCRERVHLLHARLIAPAQPPITCNPLHARHRSREIRTSLCRLRAEIRTGPPANSYCGSTNRERYRIGPAFLSRS